MRFMPLLLVAGGLAGVAKTAPGMSEHVLDTVKSILVQHEIATVARALEHGKLLGNSLPQPGQPEAFAAFIRETMSARGRDPALDLWQMPYRLEARGSTVVVVSCGPNGVRESCPDKAVPVDGAAPRSGPDDLCEPVAP